MLKYIHNRYKEKGLVNEEKTEIMEEYYLKKEKIIIKNEVFSRASEPSKIFISISSMFREIQQNLDIIELKIGFNKLNNALSLENYINSYLNVPEKFNIFRKSVSLILEKIIKKNSDKLKFIQPSKKIINLTLDLIWRINKKLTKDNIDDSIRNKLKNLENILKGYNNRKEKIKNVKNLNPPLIDFNEDEKKKLASIMEIDKYVAINKISVSEGEDINLDFIINYLFELKEKTSKTIHINEEDNLKFYSFSKQELPQKKEDDYFNEGLEKIKNILKMESNYDKISYDNLIDFLFFPNKNDFFKNKNKIDYLLSFIDVEFKKFPEDMKKKYKKVKKIFDNIPNIFNRITMMSEYEINEEKYTKFINKYKIKKNSEKIFEYVDNIVEYIMPFKLIDDENDEDNNESDEEDSLNNLNIKNKNIFNSDEKYIEREKTLRNNVKALFENDPKFITYISNYFWMKLRNYIKENQQILNNKIKLMIKNIKLKYRLFLKLEKMKEIFSELQLYNFDIKEHFKNFANDYDENLPKKFIKTSEFEKDEKVITNFNYFIKKLKEYISDVNEEVIITEEEPGQFVFKLFLQKIGFNLS